MIDQPHGGRSVPEWIGATPDAKVPDRVRDRILARAGRKCALSGVIIGPGDHWDVDHVKPLSAGGQHRESNLQPVRREVHREKSAVEAADRAKADRVRRKHLGLWPQSRAKIPSRPFPKTREKRR